MWLWCRYCGTKATSTRAPGRVCRGNRATAARSPRTGRSRSADGVDAAVVVRRWVVAGAVKRPVHRVAGHRDHRRSGGGVVLEVGDAGRVGGGDGAVDGGVRHRKRRARLNGHMAVLGGVDQAGQAAGDVKRGGVSAGDRGGAGNLVGVLVGGGGRGTGQSRSPLWSRRGSRRCYGSRSR